MANLYFPRKAFSSLSTPNRGKFRLKPYGLNVRNINHRTAHSPLGVESLGFYIDPLLVRHLIMQ